MSAALAVAKTGSTRNQGPTDPLVRAIVEGVVSELLAVLEPPKTRRLFTVDHAAEYLDFTPDAIRHMVAAKTLPVVRTSERGVRFDIADLDRWIEEHKR